MTSHNMSILALALALTFTFTGCQTTTAPTPKVDVAADTKAINALNDGLTAAFISKDAAAVAATYAGDAVMMNPDQPAAEGKQAIQAACEAMFKGTETVEVVQPITPLETQITGDWAYQRGNYTVKITPKSGKAMERSDKYLFIYKRQSDGSWKIHRDISNANTPPPAPAGKKK